MRALFLDIDGVIATPVSVRLNYLLGRQVDRQWYDQVALSYLGRLVQESGAVVVLTSTWRNDLDSPDQLARAIMANLLEQLAAAGAPMHDMTPSLPGCDRSAEVGAWLDEHPCEAYVIFDDLACFHDRPEVSAGHLVLIEESDGIRWQHYRAARRILLADRADPEPGR